MSPKSILRQSGRHRTLLKTQIQVMFNVPESDSNDMMWDVVSRTQAAKSINTEQSIRLGMVNFLGWPTETMLENNNLIRRALIAYVNQSRTEIDVDTTLAPAWAKHDTNIHDFETLPVEVIFFRLYKLHVMSNTKPKQNTVATVKQIVGLTFDRIPLLEVERTQESTSMTVSIFDPEAEDIFESDAYKTFVSRLLFEQKNQLQAVWGDVNAETPENYFADDEVLEEIRKFNFYHWLNWFLMLHIMNGGEQYDNHSVRKVRRKVAHGIRRMRCYFRRLQQLEEMYDIEKAINATDKAAHLSIENTVDLGEFPTDFRYINAVIPGDGVCISDDPPIGCKCTGKSCSNRSQACEKAHEAPIAYTTQKLINVPLGTPIFECNKRCRCSKNCVNRVVQNGRKQPLCIFKTTNGCGWGVRAVNAIAKGAYVCEYVGEVITYDEAEARGKVYRAEAKSHLFDLDFHHVDNEFTVDATRFGNVARFLNHSCDPNLGVWAVWGDCIDIKLPQICFFALRPINENEELTFDYVFPRFPG